MTSHPQATTSSPAANDPWGSRARDWSEIEDENSRALFERVFGLAGVGAGTRVLDVGCGSGLACALASGRGAEVTGLDASPGLLAIARERVPGGDFRVGDMTALPFADESFDLVTFFNTFFFAPDQAAALREAARVLRTGGQLALIAWTEPERVALSAYVGAVAPLLGEAPDIDPFLGPERLAELAADAGLAPQRSLELDWSWEYPDLDTALRGLMSPGLSVLAIEAAGEETVRRTLSDVLGSLRTASGTYRMENAVHCLLARA